MYNSLRLGIQVTLCDAKAVSIPGERPYYPGYYGAYLLDPDGNNVEAVYHGAVKRSAPSVVIEAGPDD